ncbi:MAG: hypothetical protein IPM75_15255 [Candidatus Competibacteraceae bacterium]|nr:hypothetical protein [Candidatus Competibacteraceae bacterium]
MKLGLPDRYLVYIGRIEPDKGLSYLFPWINRLNEARAAHGENPIPLVLIGEVHLESFQITLVDQLGCCQKWKNLP